MAEGDLEVEVKDDEPKPGEGTGTPAAPKSDPAPDAISDDIAQLRRQLDESERARSEAEQRATQALQRAAQVEKGATDDRLALIQSGIDTIDANLATLEAQMADAQAAGDFKLSASIQRQMAEQAAQKPDLLRGKMALEAEAKRPQQPVTLSDSQKVDLYVKELQPRAAAWIRAHPRYVLDTALNDKLLARHYSAKEAGHVEGTDGYFRFIEEGLGLPQGNGHAAPDPVPTPPASGGEQPLSSAATAVARRDVQPPAAPPSRGGGGTRKITLTPAEQEAARISGMTFEEYGKQKDIERRAGTIGKDRVH